MTCIKTEIDVASHNESDESKEDEGGDVACEEGSHSPAHKYVEQRNDGYGCNTLYDFFRTTA